jgi:hypothetical protein
MKGISIIGSNLASSYDNIMQNLSGIQYNEEIMRDNSINKNPLFEGNGGIQVRSLMLEFP